jgi:alginate O-acetyltransferase complex protein AlgI
MLFNSYTFILVFLPIVLAGCFFFAKFWDARVAQLWLIVASLYFYASWNLIYFPLLILSILFNYSIARLMTTSASSARRKFLLIFAVVMNLSTLAYYKYTNFFISSLGSLVGTNFSLPTILLPLGISFYTFQQLTLLADMRNRQPDQQLRFRHFLLFVIFFPHLIAGPIVHHREMMPQFETADYRFRWPNLAIGMSLFVMGLFKKVVIADGIATYVSPLYNSATAGHKLTFFYAWAAAFGFLLQLYFDFSGYSEMALGLARMVGIKLPVNFNSPLKATSITEHWSRWHMTLTRFLTEYVNRPLTTWFSRARKRSGKSGIGGPEIHLGAVLNIVVLPVLITMFLAGLWHGAGYQFLVWGTFHGVYISINQAWRLLISGYFRNRIRYETIMRPLGFLMTLFAVVVAIPFFRSDSVETGFNVFCGLFFLNGATLPDTIAYRMPGIAATLAQLGVTFEPGSLMTFIYTWSWIAILLTIALAAPNVIQILRSYEPAVVLPPSISASRFAASTLCGRWFVWAPNARWAMTTVALGVLAILSLTRASAFLYWQF